MGKQRRKNLFTAEWQRMLAEDLNNNMLQNTPMGKTVFAMGAGFVMMRLNEANKEWKAEWGQLYNEIKEFTEDYMAESERLRKIR